MGLRDENLGIILLKAIADSVDDHMKKVRAGHFEVLKAVYDEDGTKAFSVNLADGTKVANVTLPEGKAFFEVSDQVAFLDWAKANLPDAIETVVVPPIPEMTFEQVDTAKVNAYLKNLTHGDEGIAFDPKTGEIVDGVTYRPAGRPKNFTVTYVGEGRERVIDAWRTGQLAGLVGNDVLPQIGAK